MGFAVCSPSMRSSSPIIELRRSQPWLGTLVDIRAAAAWPAARLHRAIDAAFAAVASVHRAMSFHDPNSDLSQLNRYGARRAVQVGAQTYEVLLAARALSELSAGAFDPCVAAPLQDWGLLPRRERKTRGHANWRQIELLGDRRVRFSQPVCVDLGGIAKGFAVDRAVETLRQAGVDAALVNAGGDLRALGNRWYEIELRDPRQPARRAHRLRVRDEALATSAAYFSRARTATGAMVSALLDPATKQPYLADASVSIRAPSALSADALTKVVLFAAPEITECVLAAHDACALVLTPTAPGRGAARLLAHDDVHRDGDHRNHQADAPVHHPHPSAHGLITDVIQPVARQHEQREQREHHRAAAAAGRRAPVRRHVPRQ